MAQMSLTPENKEALLKALYGQPDHRTVEADTDTGILCKTVRELRDLLTWSGGLVVEIPREDYPEVVIKIRRPAP